MTKKNKYGVIQGVEKPSGEGDLLECGEFTNLADARKFFNSIKRDVEGWTTKGMVTTQIVRLDSSEETGYIDYIVEQFQIPTK